MRRPKEYFRHITDAELKSVQRLYEQSPFPDISADPPLEDDIDELFIHNVVTPFYLRDQRVIATRCMTILDAGCGTGSGCVLLAKANPGATVVGVDFSSSAVKIARQRVEDHGLHNIEFHVLPMRDLPQLKQAFDYINCDEVLYMQPDPAECLRSFVSVLNPNGILRINLHSFWQREPHYRAQEAARLLGIFDSKSNTEQVARFTNLMMSLRPDVDLRISTQWEKSQPGYMEDTLNNALLYGDRGSTISEMFGYLGSARLNFISMVQWRSWELSDLWNGNEALPEELSQSLHTLDLEQRLQLFELIQPVQHRLLDLWCTPQVLDSSRDSLFSWSPEVWHRARIHVHPQLCRGAARNAWERSVETHAPLNLHSFLTVTARTPINVDAQWLACLYPALDSPHMFDTLVDRWLDLYPIDPRTLVPYSRDRAETIVRDFVTRMEVFLYLLVELV